MKVLVVGSGAREHALGWRLEREPEVSGVVVAPGNAGMPEHWERWECELPPGGPGVEPEAQWLASWARRWDALMQRAREARIDLVVVGPDGALASGIVDAAERAGLLAFGPTRRAAQLEWSKGFAKGVMQRAGIPTARVWWQGQAPELPAGEQAGREIVANAWRQAAAAAAAHGVPPGLVLKADGLALGKGVIVAATLDEAHAAWKVLASVGDRVLVIEEQLSGRELSLFVLSDGERVRYWGSARDYKRRYDGDRGPNTGGMGAVSPAPGWSEAWCERTALAIAEPVVRELGRLGAPYRGVLYLGLMVNASGQAHVLEFNARLGDPEAQALLPRTEGEWLRALLACAESGGDVRQPRLTLSAETAVVVVGVAQGYPDGPLERGVPLPHAAPRAMGSGEAPSGGVFYAGVRGGRAGGLESAGGRVLSAWARAANVAAARESAYASLRECAPNRIECRSDIGEAASAGGVAAEDRSPSEGAPR